MRLGIDTVEVWGSSPHGPTIYTTVAFLYILHSETCNRYYVGSTNDLARRARRSSPETSCIYLRCRSAARLTPASRPPHG